MTDEQLDILKRIRDRTLKPQDMAEHSDAIWWLTDRGLIEVDQTPKEKPSAPSVRPLLLTEAGRTEVGDQVPVVTVTGKAAWKED